MTNWIPVSEKLPKYNKTVLISVKQIGKEARVFTAQRRKRFKTPDIFKCCTDNDGWWDFRISAWDNHEVLAWMPLPECYNETDKQLEERTNDKKQLFCENCGITEMEPAFMQKYCRYCGAKLKGGEE